MENNTLTHYGILGMKWGVRRKQSNDGSSTVGKKTSKTQTMSDEDLSASVRRMNLEKMHDDLIKKNTKASKMEKAKKVMDATTTLVNQGKTLNRDSINNSNKKVSLDLSNMTDQQLRDRINRTNLEKQYNNLFGTEAVTVSKGQRYASNVLDVAGTTLVVGSSALGIALAIKELKK